MATTYSEPKIPEADSGQTVLDTEGMASLGEAPTPTIIDNGALQVPSAPGDPYGKIRSVSNFMYAGYQYTITFEVWGVEYTLYMGDHYITSGSAPPGKSTYNVSFTPSLSWPDLDEGENTLTLTTNYYTPTTDTATVYIADKEKCWESLASATSYELISEAANDEPSSWEFDNYIDGSQIALVLKPSNNVTAEITSCPEYLWYDQDSGGISDNIGIDINLNLYYQLLVGSEILADGYGNGAEIIPVTPVIGIGDGSQTVTLNVYYQDYVIKSDTDSTTFVTADITTNPEDLYYGSASNTVVVDVTDGYGWSLTVNSEAADSDTGTGENQNATFTPTAAMVGEDVQLLLTAGNSTHADTVTVHRSQIVSCPKLYVGYESNIVVNCTDYTDFIPYINSIAGTTEKTGTGSNQNVPVTPTADMEGVGVPVELKHGAIVGGHTTATVVGVELVTVPDPIYPDVECTFVVKVTDDESFTLKINNVTAATGKGTGENQNVIFDPTSGMVGSDVDVTLTSGYAADGYTTNCLADITIAEFYEDTYCTTWGSVNNASTYNPDIMIADGSNRMLILFVSAEHGNAASISASVFDDENEEYEMTKIVQIYNPDDAYDTWSVAAFCLLEADIPDAEYPQLIVSVPSGTKIMTSWIQLNGAAQSTPSYDADQVNSSSISSTVTTTKDKAWLIGYLSGHRSTARDYYTPTSGQTALYDAPQQNEYSVYQMQISGYEIINSHGTESMSWSSYYTHNMAQILLDIEPL